MKGIADTGLLVAFLNRDDVHHEWAVGLARRVTEGLVAVAFECSEHLAQLTTLAKRYEDRHPDLADLCLIRMSELYPRHSVITVDREDFRIFRRNKREAIPLICPPPR